MEAENQEVAALVEKISGLQAAIAKLPSLSPSPEVDALFTELVAACVPPSPVDVTKLGPEAQRMREELIRLCSAAEGHLEAHYADKLAAFDNPLDHLDRFPYYSNYISLSKLEYELLARYVPSSSGVDPARVAFVGSGPPPFTSLVLAARHLPNTLFDNYDWSEPANERARRLVRGGDDRGVGARMSFLTADVAELTGSWRSTTWCSWRRWWAWRRRTRRPWSRTWAGTWRRAPRSWCGARTAREGSCTRSWTRRSSPGAGSTCWPCTTPTTRS